MRAVFLVLVADGFQHVAVRQQNLSRLTLGAYLFVLISVAVYAWRRGKSPGRHQ